MSNFEEVTLSNGIPVILQNYEGPAAATYWWIQTGSADEGARQEGFAHFLEHMLFKDAAAKETGRGSTGQMARAIESLGGDINAYTSFDQTVYHVTCAANHWENVLDVFGTMARPQRFLKSDFEREREVILEELRKNEDSPSRSLFQALFSATFSRHPYGRPVIGYAKTLKAAKVAELESFYKRNYVSERMGLVLVGPIADRARMLKKLEKHFGAGVIPKGKGLRLPRKADAELAARPRWVERRFDVNSPTLAFSFRAPHLRHDEAPALDLISGVLAMGELGRLYQRLFYGEKAVTDVSGGLYIPSDPGMMYFQAEIEDPGKITPVLESMLDELRRFTQDAAPTREELDRVIANIESERLYATQTVDGLAGRLGFMRFVLGDNDFDRRYIETLKALEPKQLQTLAAKYFDPRRLSGALLYPKNLPKFDVRELEKTTLRVLKGMGEIAPRVGAGKTPKAKGQATQKPDPIIAGPAPETIVMPSGLRILYRERPQSPVVSIHAAVPGGLRLELTDPVESAQKDWGSSYVLSLTWTKGTRQRSAKDIAGIVEGRAANLDGFSGRNTIGLQMTGLARDWDSLSDVFSDVLVEPTFPQDEVEHSRRVAEDSVRSIEDHSSQLCSKLFLETLFESHPYGKMTIGSLESLSTVGSEKLQAFHRRWLRPERLVVTVVGAVDRKQIEAFARSLEDRLRGIARDGAGNLNGLRPEPLLRAPRWAERNLGREQIHILVGGIGSTLRSEDREAIHILQTLLGGQSGRLFIELREKKSLAYTVAPVSFEGIEPGYIGTYIACSPHKRREALEGIRTVLERLAAKGPAADEMERAKQFLLGRRAMDLQSDGSLAAHYGLEAVYGIPLQSDREIVEEVESISADDIREVCRKYLIDPAQVTTVVG